MEETSKKEIREIVKEYFQKLKALRIKKIYLEYIAAILTIPVLIAALIINYSTLLKGKTQTSGTSSLTPVVTTASPVPSITPTSGACNANIGPLTITYPQEGQSVSDNPVCVIISYQNQYYCSVVWSYQINGSSWSSYNNGNPCLYNLSNGNVQFNLRVDSTVSDQQETITRNFIYAGANNPVVTPTLTPTPTLTLTPTPTPTLTITPSPTVVATQSAQ